MKKPFCKCWSPKLQRKKPWSKPAMPLEYHTYLINRLEELILYKYPKMFVKLQKAGGGVLHMSCPHSVVYYQSALWWQESARDHGDALLSFKHPPTVDVSDIAGRVARHVNNRTSQRFLQPYDGRLCENTAAHIQT